MTTTRPAAAVQLPPVVHINGNAFYQADPSKLPPDYQLKTVLRIGTSTGPLFQDDTLPGMSDAEQDAHHKKHRNQPLQIGPAFTLVKKLLELNQTFPKDYIESCGDAFPVLVDVITQRRPDRPFYERFLLSMQHYGMFDIPYGWAEKHFTGDEQDPRLWDGKSMSHVVAMHHAIGGNIYLSANGDIADQLSFFGKLALHVDQKFTPNPELLKGGLKVAFDLDKTVFDGTTDEVFVTQGLIPTLKHEHENVKKPIGPGPAVDFITRLAILRKLYPKASFIHPEHGTVVSPLRMGPATLRGNTHHWMRAILSLIHYGIPRDFEHFMYGGNKGERLKVLLPDILIDDSLAHIKAVQGSGIPGAHLRYAKKSE